MTSTKKMKDKTIADQLKQNKSEALKRLFRISRQSKKNNKDIIGMPFILDRNIKVSLKDKMEVWKECKETLLSEEINGMEN